MSRIDTFNIKGRVRLSISKRLSLSQHIIKLASLIPHFTENKVSRAIDNSRQPFYFVARESLSKRLDKWNTTGDSGLIAHAHSVFICQRKNFISVLCY